MIQNCSRGLRLSLFWVNNFFHPKLHRVNHPESDLASLTSMINEPHLPRCILQDNSYPHQSDQTFEGVRGNKPSGRPPGSRDASIYLVQTQQWVFHLWSKVNKQTHISAGRIFLKKKKTSTKTTKVSFLFIRESQSINFDGQTLKLEKSEAHKMLSRHLEFRVTCKVYIILLWDSTKIFYNTQMNFFYLNKYHFHLKCLDLDIFV